MNGAQAMVKCLEAEGISRIFGYPGVAIAPFYDALYDSRRIEFIRRALSGVEKCLADGIPVKGYCYWSLMDYGSYENEGFSPVGYSAFDKFSLGWLDLEEVGTPADYTLHEIGTEPDPANGVHTAYRLSTPYDNIYFIMENRQKTGWYRYSATEGMLVTAVNYNASNWNNNTINVSTKRLYSVNADNDNNRKTYAGDLFPYGDEDSLTTAGSPSLSIDGTVPYYSLYGIRNQNGLVTFTASSKMPTRVQENADSDVEININDGVLTVSAPCGSRLSVHDLSGHAILETVMTEPTFQTVLPEHGVWLIKCGNKTRKVRN